MLKITNLKILTIFTMAFLLFSAAYSFSNQGSEEITSQDNTLSLDLKDSELKDVLRTISKVSGINIVAGEEIKGKVTARFENVEIKQALTCVLRSCGYDYVKEGNVIRVVKAEPELLGVDSKTPQVLIESKIVEVILDKSFEMGVNWKEFKLKFEEEDRRSNPNLEAKTNFNMGDKGLLVDVFDTDVKAILQLLSEKTKTNILSSPKIVALDNKPAQILVGDRVPYQQTFGQAQAGITTTSILFEDVGIKLMVTPHVRGQGYVILDIQAEVSSISEWKILSNGDELPLISTKKTDTQVVIKDGSTLIIGGLISERKGEIISKVPLLGDIPIINHLFRYKKLQNEKRELVVFITPRILLGSQG